MAKSLLECKNLDQVCELKRDNFSYGDFSILSDGHSTWLSQQKVGESPVQSFEIPKRKFDYLIRKYIASQK